MRTTKIRTILMTLAVMIGISTLLSPVSPSRPVIADESVAAAAAATNIFHGTYQGGFWGKANSIPYGGDIKGTVSTTGNAIISLPGAGTGTVATTGVSTISGTLKVSGVSVNITYTGRFVPTKNPATGAVLSVTGSGTWISTTSGITASGKWLVKRTLTTP